MILDGMLEGIVARFRDANGRFLPEHETEYLEPVGDNPFTVVCYLECQEGKEFRIEIKKDRPWYGPDLKMYFYIDGRRISKRPWPAEHRRKDFDRITEKRDGVVLNAKLQFSKLEVTDRHDIACNDPEILSGLGEIRIDFAAGEAYQCNCKNRPGGCVPARVIGPIHEEAKKGLIGSTVSGGTAVQEGGMRRRHLEQQAHYHIPDSETIYRIIFKYRTRELLMAQRIVGIAPTPLKPKMERKRKRQYENEVDEGDENDIILVEDMCFGNRLIKRRTTIAFEDDIKPIFFESVRRQGPGSILQPIDLTLE